MQVREHAFCIANTHRPCSAEVSAVLTPRENRGSVGILTQQHQKAEQDQADGVGPQPPGWLVSIPGPGLGGCCTRVPVVTLTHLHSQVVGGVALPVLSVCDHEGDGVPPGGQRLLGGQQRGGGCRETITQINSGTGAFSLKTTAACYQPEFRGRPCCEQ